MLAGLFIFKPDVNSAERPAEQDAVAALQLASQGVHVRSKLALAFLVPSPRQGQVLGSLKYLRWIGLPMVIAPDQVF